MRRESQSGSHAIEQRIVELKNKEKNTVTSMLVLIVAFVGICLYFVLGDSKSSSRNEASDKTQVNIPKENLPKDRNAKTVNLGEGGK
jgi:hypothetical protein